jgi:acylpyruvate hydrolase
MRLVSFGYDGKICLGALLNDSIVDLKQACSSPGRKKQKRFPAGMLEFLEAGENALIAANQAMQLIQELSPYELITWREKKRLLPLHQVNLFAPVPRPGKIICIGSNYPIAEQSSSHLEYPIIFLKPASSVIGPGTPIYIPPVAREVAYEAELAVVIGQRASRLVENEALGCIAGYTIANDLGDRLLEKRTSQWTTGKLMDTFCPMGPTLVTQDEVPDPNNLEINTWLNGKLVQQGNTSMMFFNITYLVSYLSHLTTLEPGDIILTGSPKCLGKQPAPSITLQDHDRIVIEIGNLGQLVNSICFVR